VNLLDIRTVIFSHVITSAVCAIVLTYSWFRNRVRFAGLGFWLAAFFLQVVAVVLIALRGILPDFLSIVVGNTLIIAATSLLYEGLARFVDQKVSQVHNYLLLVVFFFIFTYFTFVQSSLFIRSITLSVGIILVCAQCAWLLFYRPDASMRPITRGTGYIFLAICAASLARIVSLLVVDPGNDFFQASVFEALAILIDQILFVILTFGLLLMVNRRLVADLEHYIVEQERVEEELRRSEVLLLQTGEMAKVGGWELDTQTMTPYWSPQIYRIHEVDSSVQPDLEDSVGYYTQEARPVIREAVQRAMEQGEAYDLELPIVTAKGNPLWIRTMGQAEFRDGKCVRLFGAFQDITERKQKDEILRNRTAILAALHQVALDLIQRHELEEILQTLLAKTSALLNVQQVSIDLIENEDTLVTYAATPGQPLSKGDRMHRGEGGWLSWQAIENGSPAVLEDYSTWTKRRELYEGFPLYAMAILPILQGDHVIGTINVSRSEPNKPFNDLELYAGQQLAQMVALVLDNVQLYDKLESELAERKRVEEDLRRSREDFHRYFNMSTVGMGVTSPDRRWIESNGHLRQMLGYSAEELDNLTWSEITHPADLDADLRLFDQVLANERDSYQLDKRLIRKDGSILYVTLFATCHRNPDGSVRYMLASLVDITDRKRGEEASLRLAALEERQRLARDLHDSVNQSIHGLVLFSETLVSTLQKNNSDRARQIAGRLEETARQALKETRLMLYEMQTTDPERSVDLIKDLEVRLVTVERRAGVRAQITQEGSLDHFPQMWHANLFWIAIEALNNAIKHAQARSIQIKIRCSATHVDLEVIDDGIGFDTNTPRVGGLGLQSMCDRASLLGGQLTIHSAPKKGSRVRFIAEIQGIVRDETIQQS
jgi:PAS domain S-box-containing protein